jgi:type II secretory pathway component GspD/PulD (secretin)
MTPNHPSGFCLAKPSALFSVMSVKTPMKIALLACCLVGFASLAAETNTQTYSSLDKPSAKNQVTMPAGAIKLEDADLEQVFKLYQTISRRTVVRPAIVPNGKITLHNEMPITVPKALQLLDTALAQHAIIMIPQGIDTVKAVPISSAPNEAVPICELAAEELPESNSYTHYIVHLKSRSPRELAQILQPLAKFPNSIMSNERDGMIMLRDYSVNIRRMLQVIERLDKNPKPQPQ